MNSNRKFLILSIVMVIIIVFVLTACHTRSTYSQRCDDVLHLQAFNVEAKGWLFCDPSYDADEQSQCSNHICTMVVQWTHDGKHNVACPCLWIWDRNVQNDYWLNVYAWMGVYQIDAYRAGRFSGYSAGVPPNIYQESFQWAVQVA